MTKITKGCYVETSEIKDTEEWKKVIDAFIGAGFHEYEGYTKDCETDYSDNWRDWLWLGIDPDVGIYHSDYEPETVLTVQEVLGTDQPTPIEYMFVNDLSINMNQTKEERVSELGEEGWILGGIEPTGTYVFYREKS